MLHVFCICIPVLMLKLYVDLYHRWRAWLLATYLLGNGFVTISFLFSHSGPYKLRLHSTGWRFNHSSCTYSFSWFSSSIIAMHFTAQQYAKSMHLIISSVICSSHFLFVNSFINAFLQEELLRLIKYVEQTSGMPLYHMLLTVVPFMSTVATTDYYYTSNTGNSMELSDVGSNDISLVRILVF